MKEFIAKLVEGRHLTAQEAERAMEIIMSGGATDAQIACFLTALRMKGETVEEIVGCARAMRARATRVPHSQPLVVDTCGTGGDGSGTFNISTAAAFVVAGAGVPVAKHGNRSVSSRSGSADVLEALGVNLELSPEQVGKCLDEVGIGFLFAPKLHLSMKFAAGPRREMGIRTIFNLLGPLTNPAGAQAQVMGVYDGRLTEPVARALASLGTARSLVVHGAGGLDEISLAGPTVVSEAGPAGVHTYTIYPEDLGLDRAGLEAVAGGDPGQNAGIIRAVLGGERGPRRDVVLANAAAALVAAGTARDLRTGVRMAAESIDSGRALAKLEALRRVSQELAGAGADRAAG